MSLARLVGSLVLVAFSVRPAWPWGCDAHHVVAMVAAGLLTEHARREATALLVSHPIPRGLHRFCRPADDPVVDASTWADDVRGERPETAPWHYIDIPRSATKMDDGCTAGGCVTRAIEHELGVLRSQASGERRAEALRWLIHLVADLHQPLHCATNGDKGGNCVPVAYLDEKPVRDPHTRKYLPNLHAVWDTGLVNTLIARRARPRTAAGLAAALRARFAGALQDWVAESATPAEWAWETHRVAVDVAYGQLRPAPAVEPPIDVDDCRENRSVGARMSRLGIRIDAAYVDAALPEVERRLARASARLAGLLNATWP